VERSTGVLISTSEPDIRVLRDYSTSASYNDVILATECPDARVSERAKKLLEMTGGSAKDWGAVRNTLGDQDHWHGAGGGVPSFSRLRVRGTGLGYRHHDPWGDDLGGY
ncbi:unnamed protein product, partial [Symbiodinium pilosum]